MRYSNRHTLFTLLIISISLLAGSCDNPASTDDDGHEEDEHKFPVGAVFTLNGEDIAAYRDGEVTGQIAVEEGEETALITIYFIAEDGDRFQPVEAEYSLQWEENDESIAEVEQHNEDERWRFHVQGVNTGTTGVVFQLYHVPGDHSDFNTLPIPITVN